MTPTNTSVTSARSEKKGGAWIALLIAGGVEVGYALSVNGSAGFTKPLWSATAVVFFLFTLFFLSVALKKIDVGIGYAVCANSPPSLTRTGSGCGCRAVPAYEYRSGSPTR